LRGGGQWGLKYPKQIKSSGIGSSSPAQRMGLFLVLSRGKWHGYPFSLQKGDADPRADSEFLSFPQRGSRPAGPWYPRAAPQLELARARAAVVSLSPRPSAASSDFSLELRQTRSGPCKAASVGSGVDAVAPEMGTASSRSHHRLAKHCPAAAKLRARTGRVFIWGILRDRG